MFFLFLLFIKSHKCIHDEIIKNIPLISEIKNETRKILSEEHIGPLRVFFDFNTIEKKLDPNQCHQVGQTVRWQNNDHICRESDIVSNEKLLILKSTFTNLQNYISRAIQVDQYQGKLSLTDISSSGYPVEQRDVDGDIAITVYIRHFGDESSTLAVAASFKTQFLSNRPIQGFIVINANTIPTKIETELSPNRYFFSICFHEMMHALGFSSHLFSKWLNRETGFAWGSNFPLTDITIPKYGNKKFSILHTPLIKKYAEQRWNRTEILPGIPMGIELEDQGGTGTAGSHVKGKTFFNEVMVGLIITPFRISDLMFSLLEDMGWYFCNWSLVEPLPWGAGESIGEKPLIDFPFSPPVPAINSFPSHYVCTQEQVNTNLCSYDFSASAKCLSITNDSCTEIITENSQIFCKNKQYYDPNNLNQRGNSPVHDFMFLKLTNQDLVCADPSFENKSNSIIKDMTFGSNSMCSMIELDNIKSPACYNMFCDENNTNIIYIQTKSKNLTCNYNNEIINISPGLNIICPDPKLICNLKLYLNKKFITPNRIELANPWPSVIITLIIILLILIGCCYCICRFTCCKHNYNKIDESENSIKSPLNY